MERCVYKHVYNFLLENGIITFNQSGFTPGDSAINQLLFITNEFGKALDEGKEIRVVFCDISKAFDRVWHKGLLKKLKSIGIRGSLLSWMELINKNMFTPRTRYFFVLYGDELQIYSNVTALNNISELRAKVINFIFCK